jgi:hypothetical protein
MAADVVAPVPGEKPPTARIAAAPIPGFGVRFLTEGPNSPLNAWFFEEPSAAEYAAENVAQRALVVPATATFE